MATLVEVKTKRAHRLGRNTVIGRATTCEIQVADPMVSESHAEIARQPDGTFEIRDLRSRRGTFVGARKVAAAPLEHGDELLIGAVRFRFEHDAAPRRANDERTRLRAIVDLGRAVGVEHDLERVLSRVLETCFQLLRADRGALVVYQPHSSVPYATVTRDRHGDQPFAVSRSVVGDVMATHRPYLRTEVDTDAVLQRAASLSMHGVRSVMAVPLRYAEAEWLGVLLLDSSAMVNVFDERDLELLEAIARPTSLAIKNALLVRRLRDTRDDEWRRLERIVCDLPLGVVVLEGRRCAMVNPWVTARASELGDLGPGDEVDAIAGVPCEQLLGADLKTTVTTATERVLAIAATTMSGGRETVIVIHDLTEERERQSQAAHKDRIAVVGQLAGGVAHDFNNLLHVMLTYANMIEESVADADQRDDAHQIVHAAGTAAELTRQLLTFSRHETIQPKVVDVARCVRGMEKIMIKSLGEETELELAIAPNVPRVMTDASQLDQIVMNLVVNARDAMGGHGCVTLRVGRLELVAPTRTLAPGTYASIEVADTGSGMPPDVLARIFEPYFTTKPRGKGTGLGLATVHGIVQQMHGDIAVESTVGRGTTFRILLPATEHAGDSERVSTAPLVANATVLVVDDDDDVRRVTERALRAVGFHVLSADSGQTALALARTHTGAIDLLLIDVVMPGMSGRDLAQELATTRAIERVIFMSGYDQHAPVENAQFISKPFHRSELLDKVRATLGDGDVKRS